MRTVLWAGAAVWLAGCSCSEGTAMIIGDGSTNHTDAAGSDAPAGGDGAASTTEVCDHLDNDNNGIIDDVDAGGDGICDCLSIGTLGLSGTWGTGDVFQGWLAARSSYPVVDLGAQVLTPALLQPFMVIVIQDIRGRDYSDDEVNALQGWVQGGGGVMTLIGYGDPDEITNVNRLLSPYGIHYGATPILPQAGGSTIPITVWHPHAVSDQIMRLGIDNGYEVQGEGTLIAEEMSLSVLHGLEVGLGKVLVWGDEWITYDSEWQMHPDYQVERFWVNSIKWLTAADMCQVPILF